MKIKKTIGILLAVCFMLSVTVASVSAAPDPRQGALGYGSKNQPAPGYDVKKIQFPVDMGKWNSEKRSWDNQKTKWDNEKRKWDRDREKNRKHKNDYMKWYRMFLQWLSQFNMWNNKYSHWASNYNDHFRGEW